MSNYYEVEHNIKEAAESGRKTRRVDMSTFLSFYDGITPDAADAAAAAGSSGRRDHVFSEPTPRDMSVLYRLTRDQLGTLAATAPTRENREWLEALVSVLSVDTDAPPVDFNGVSAEFVTALDRVDKKKLRPDDSCPICTERFLDDPYPLVVVLPCHTSHRFDLECVQPWLLSKGSCPMCREDFSPKPKQTVKDDDAESDDDGGGMYA